MPILNETLDDKTPNSIVNDCDKELRKKSLPKHLTDIGLPALSMCETDSYKEEYMLKKLKSINKGFGKQCWFNTAGQLHREGAPAIIFNDGKKIWYKNGKNSP